MAEVIKDLEVGRLSWIISRWAQCPHKGPYEEKGRRVRVWEGGVTVQAEVKDEDLKMLCWWPGR